MTLIHSQSPIRLLRTIAQKRDPHWPSATWRDAWISAGHRNPVPDILSLDRQSARVLYRRWDARSRPRWADRRVAKPVWPIPLAMTCRRPRSYNRFRCVDCGKDTSDSGEYYSVRDDVWAASGLAANDGMLCLACLERRIKRPLTAADFAALWPTASAWKRHIAARAATDRTGAAWRIQNSEIFL